MRTMLLAVKNEYVTQRRGMKNQVAVADDDAGMDRDNDDVNNAEKTVLVAAVVVDDDDDEA